MLTPSLYRPTKTELGLFRKLFKKFFREKTDKKQPLRNNPERLKRRIIYRLNYMEKCIVVDIEDRIF